MGTYGLPQNEIDHQFYVRRVCNALANVDDVWDADVSPWAIAQLLPGGELINPLEIEAIAWSVVWQARRIHTEGVIGLKFLRMNIWKPSQRMDLEMTFAQRIHLLSHLLARCKLIASDVMSMQDIERYVALPLSTLWGFPQFESEWNSLSEADRNLTLYVDPYPPGITHPHPDTRRPHPIRPVGPTIPASFMGAQSLRQTARPQTLNVLGKRSSPIDTEPQVRVPNNGQDTISGPRNGPVKDFATRQA